MFLREKIAIAFAVSIIGLASLDAAFTENPPVNPPVKDESLTGRPPHRIPPEATQAPEPTAPVSTVPAPVQREQTDAERIEELESALEDAEQAAEDGE